MKTARRRLEHYTDIHNIHPREALYDLATSAESFEQESAGRKTTDRTKAGAQQLLDVLAELTKAAEHPTTSQRRHGITAPRLMRNGRILPNPTRATVKIAGPTSTAYGKWPSNTKAN